MITPKVTEALISYEPEKRVLIPDRSTPTLGTIQQSVFQNVLGILSLEKKGPLDEGITHVRLMMGLRI